MPDITTQDVTTYRGYETVPQAVEQQVQPGVEIRRYAPHLLAQVTVSGARRDALTRGFGILARYIFGGNSAASKIAMTAPVAQSSRIAMTAPVGQATAGEDWTVTFMMPSQYNRENLPRPKSDAITFEDVPGSRQIVLQFSGRATDAAIARREAELRNAADAAGFAIREPVFLRYFDAPMTVPWRRRNEVAFELA